jgi:hypothetical protein
MAIAAIKGRYSGWKTSEMVLIQCAFGMLDADIFLLAARQW